MSEYTAHPTQPGNTHELTSPGTLNYDITRSGSTRRWGTEPQMKSSGNGSNNTEQRRNPKIPCPEISGLLKQISFGKLNNVRAAIEICRNARTILGGNGITLDHSPLRHANNLESVRTYEGTDEVHTLIMGRAITGIPAFA